MPRGWHEQVLCNHQRAIKNFLREIVFIQRYAKDSKFIGTSFDVLKEVSDTLRTLGEIFEVALDLFNASLGWLVISVGEDDPSIT